MAGGKVIKVLYEDNHIIVVLKPVNMLVQGDNTKDPDMLTELKKMIKLRDHKPGNVYLGLVHRLDRPVGGVMVFAKTSKAASRLSASIRANQIHKEYRAIVVGQINKEGSYNDHMLKDKRTNISHIDSNGKEASLTYKCLGYKNNLSLVSINLITGRSHQIRVQFSYHGYPLYGDQKYNNNATKDNIALYAYSLTFPHPVTKEVMTFTGELPEKYPFSLFN